MKLFLKSLIILVSFIFIQCNESSSTDPADVFSYEQQYHNAIIDAMVADSNEISNTLTDISPYNTNLIWAGTDTNKRVLVVTWTKYYSSYPVNDTIQLKWGETWVTVAPEIKNFFKTHTYTTDKQTLRTEQLLGLPKDKGYTHFVEMWVKPTDLFRPAPDSGITDKRAELNFSTNIDAGYKTWYNNNIIYSYYPMKFPWTRLGYTYDWGNPTCEIGLSEFVIKSNAVVIVKLVSQTSEYLK